MNLKKIKLGATYARNNAFLAPLAGYTNAPFRQLCYDFGAGLTFTEMVSAKGLVYGSEKTEDLLKITPEYDGVKACQIFGNDPKIMRAACESEALAPFDLIDINMGCPVPKIYKNGEGSYLLNDKKLAAEIVSECKKSGKIISVKYRIGLSEDRLIAAEFARILEDAGADMLCVHGRTRDKMYAGEPNFAEIAAAKNAVKIPVIANGGVFSAADADALMQKTGADGVAVARGAMYRPWIFAEFTGRGKGDLRGKVRRQLELTREFYGERFACVYMRKMIAFYLRGQPNSAAMRQRLLATPATEELEAILNEVEFM